MGKIIYREESYKIIGACFEVYKQKNCGFTEPVYQECLALEFGLQGIPWKIDLVAKYRIGLGVSGGIVVSVART